ncbi:UDP-3-O-(3-hydroxymyristoyl)glucosamine N-acyltransferase [bacterium]|nr:UDP-3-O-(3-hydroxymyristoyl)glucosamine N-acyltransferase [bacterium]
MEIPVSVIAGLLEAEVKGDPNTIVSGFGGINEAKPGDITFLNVEKYIPSLMTTKAAAVLVRASLNIPENCPPTLIIVPDPQLALQKLLEKVAPPKVEFAPGVHPTAVVAPSAVLGKNVSVQPYAVIEEGATIGDNCVIGAFCYVGHFTEIGNDSFLYPHVTIRERIKIGERVTIHPGTVIGADGFGYLEINGKREKVPQIGNVSIGDDVEIGANTCIDRARLDTTIVKRGAKIDNLCQIAHNCEVGEDSVMCGCSAMSGSTKIGNRVILAGQAGLNGHIEICDDVIIGGQCGVTKDIHTPGFYIGSPATPHITYKKRESVVVKLPLILKELHDLEKEVAALKEELAKAKENK